MKTSRSLHVDAPLDSVAAALCCEALNVDVEQQREGVVSTRFELVEQSETRTKFSMHTTEYARNKLGRLDKSRTFSSVTRSVYDAAARRLRWEYFADEGMAKRIQLSGTYKLSEERGGTFLAHEIDVEVDIPLIGGQLAKLIAKELDDTMPVIEKALKRHMK